MGPRGKRFNPKGKGPIKKPANVKKDKNEFKYPKTNKKNENKQHKGRSTFQPAPEVDAEEQPEIAELTPWWDKITIEVEGLQPRTDTISHHEIARLRAQAEKELKTDTQGYLKAHAIYSKSEASWLQQVTQKGTSADKVVGLVLLIQDSPMHRVAELDHLINMASKKSRREALIALDNLRDLFASYILPNDRKLRFFRESVATVVRPPPSLLALFLFEEIAKTRFANYISCLEIASRDPLRLHKERAMQHMEKILEEKVEQEQTLLTLLVNKIGDPDKQVASKAIYLLRKLLEVHFAMREVVCKEVTRLLFRKNMLSKAKYFAINFLCQIIYTKDDADLASSNIDTFLATFSSVVDPVTGDIEEGDAKLVACILSGVNRAAPFASLSSVLYEKHLTAIFKVVHSSSLPTATQALALLFQISVANPAIGDRFYKALYEILFSPALRTSIKISFFLSLLFKAIKADPSTTRACALVKRSMQLASIFPANAACGLLHSLSLIISERPAFANYLKQSEKSLKIQRARAEAELEVKRNGVTVEKAHTKKQKKKQQKNVHNLAEETQKKIEELTAEKVMSVPTYSTDARDPLYSNADTSCFWELTCLARHIHPSVRAFAETTMKCAAVQYKGDPSRDNTLADFLEKFIHKKEKKRKAGGTSVMQPLVKPDVSEKDLPEDLKGFLAEDEETDESEMERYLLSTLPEGRAMLEEDDDDDDDAEFAKAYENAVSDDESDKEGDGAESEGEMDEETFKKLYMTNDNDKEFEMSDGEEEDGDDESGYDEDLSALNAGFDSESDENDSDDE